MSKVNPKVVTGILAVVTFLIVAVPVIRNYIVILLFGIIIGYLLP